MKTQVRKHLRRTRRKIAVVRKHLRNFSSIKKFRATTPRLAKPAKTIGYGRQEREKLLQWKLVKDADIDTRRAAINKAIMGGDEWMLNHFVKKEKNPELKMILVKYAPNIKKYLNDKDQRISRNAKAILLGQPPPY